MKYHVLTTCSAAGWEQTGRRMAQSVVDQWPVDAMPLTVYAEDFEPDVVGVEARTLPEWMAEFKARHAASPARNGRRPGGSYDYRFDAVKFAHKVAAITDFGLSLTDGVMIWLDADTYTHAPVTADWLAGLFPTSAYIAWLDRDGTHIEAGFLMFRCSHGYHQRFMESLRNVYVSGDVFRLPQTHDSYVIQHLAMAKALHDKIPRPHSLSGIGRRYSHVLVNSPIGSRIDHAKGARKEAGRTPKRERFISDGNPYWS